MLDEVRARADDFDILHFHVDYLHFPLFDDIAAPHRDDAARPARPAGPARPCTRVGRDVPLVSISTTSAGRCRSAQLGRPPSTTACRSTSSSFAPRRSGGYLAFLGRISPEKRPDRAIEIASAAGMPLKIAAKVDAVDARLLPTTRSSRCSTTR